MQPDFSPDDKRSQEQIGTENHESAASADEIRATLRLFCEPGQVVEIRPLPPGPKNKPRCFADHEAAADYAATLDALGEAKGLYFTQNPIRPDIAPTASAKDEDVLRRRWLALDFDPDRPEGACETDPKRPAGTCATDQEKAAAVARAAEVKAFLDARGWPAPVQADSGNGRYLCYKIDLPNDDAAADLIRDVLLAMDTRFSDPSVRVDRSMFNSSRIVRLFGTVNRKGNGSHERPHRRSRLLHVPEPLEIVTAGMLAALAAEVRPPAPDPTVPLDLDAEIERKRSTAERAKANGRREAGSPWIGATVADDYAARGPDWSEILTVAKWTLAETRPDGERWWTRPGKRVEDGHSATTGHDGRDCLHVFTDDAKPFSPNGTYSKFQVYAIINHRGDESAAAKVLYAQGFGTRQPPPPPTDDDRPEWHADASNRLLDDGWGTAPSGNGHPPDQGGQTGRGGDDDDDAQHRTSMPSFWEEHGCLHGARGALANFSARIVTQIERHDAGEVRRVFEIKAQHSDGRHATAKVAAAKFDAMTWVPDQLGAEYIIFPGRTFKDEVRAGIQILSLRDGISKVEVHTALGWIEHDGRQIYLHAGGCISADGPSDAVIVEASPALATYRLPTPPTSPQDVADAVESVFRLLELGKANRPASGQCAAVLASLPWRAVLAPFNSSVHFSGETGTRKTSAARLGLGFFALGAGVRDGDVSCVWTATLNALQRYTHDCRDSLLLVDELTGSKAISTASDFFQAQGNLKAKDRMTKELTLAPSLNPRGSVLSTGEADPTRQSALGRMLTIRFSKQTLADDAALGQCQTDSRDGLHARSMSTFVKWLAAPGRLEAMRSRLRKRTREIEDELARDATIPDVHSRQPAAVAELRAAFEIFLDFAVELAGVARLSADAYLRTVADGLVDVLRGQSTHHRESNPGRRFLAMLAGALGSKRYHLEHVDQDKDLGDYADALGWSRDNLSWKVSAGSTRLGYVDVDAKIAYLDPELAKVLAQTMGRDAGDPFESTANIGRDLHGIGALVIRGMETGRKHRFAPTKRIRGVSNRYLWIRLDALFGGDDRDDVGI